MVVHLPQAHLLLALRLDLVILNQPVGSCAGYHGVVRIESVRLIMAIERVS
jgi:hypothetical protein